MGLEDLKKIGLTEGEIKVYEALLELGECTKTRLAKRSGIAPSNIYDVTNRLLEKGIISKVEKDGVAHFSPANPRRILAFLDEKEKEIEQEKDFVNSILPTLLAQFSEAKQGVKVEVFQGWKGMRTVFEDLLEECQKGDYNYVFGASKGEEGQKADIFFRKYSGLREKKGIITNIIFNEELRLRDERTSSLLHFKKNKVKFLKQITPAEILLYKDKTHIVILSKEPLVIRITSKEVWDSFKQYFDVMWKKAQV